MNSIFRCQVILTLVCALVGTNHLLAQAAADSLSGSNEITYSNYGGKIEFRQSGKDLDRRELFEVLNEDYESAEYVGKYKTKNAISTPLGFLGGGLIGYPLGQLIAGGDPVWALAIGGAGFLALGLPLSISANKDLKRGVEVYNSNLKTSARKTRGTLRMGMVNSGIGIGWRF